MPCWLLIFVLSNLALCMQWLRLHHTLEGGCHSIRVFTIVGGSDQAAYFDLLVPGRLVTSLQEALCPLLDDETMCRSI